MEWELVFRSNQEYKIVIITELLAEAEIISRYINKKDSNYLMGYYELYVNPQDVIKAKHIIEKTEL